MFSDPDAPDFVLDADAQGHGYVVFVQDDGTHTLVLGLRGDGRPTISSIVAASPASMIVGGDLGNGDVRLVGSSGGEVAWS